MNINNYHILSIITFYSLIDLSDEVIISASLLKNILLDFYMQKFIIAFSLILFVSGCASSQEIEARKREEIQKSFQSHSYVFGKLRVLPEQSGSCNFVLTATTPPTPVGADQAYDLLSPVPNTERTSSLMRGSDYIGAYLTPGEYSVFAYCVSIASSTYANKEYVLLPYKIHVPDTGSAYYWGDIALLAYTDVYKDNGYLLGSLKYMFDVRGNTLKTATDIADNFGTAESAYNNSEKRRFAPQTPLYKNIAIKYDIPPSYERVFLTN